MRECIDIADSIVNGLNSAADGTFSFEFTAVRTVLPEYELSELSVLTVSIVPSEAEITKSSRSNSQYDFSIDIGVQKKVSDVETDVLSLSELVSEIIDYLTSRQLPDIPWAVFSRISNAPIYSPEMLRDKKLFVSVIRIKYRAMK